MCVCVGVGVCVGGCVCVCVGWVGVRQKGCVEKQTKQMRHNVNNKCTWMYSSFSCNFALTLNSFPNTADP